MELTRYRRGNNCQNQPLDSEPLISYSFSSEIAKIIAWWIRFHLNCRRFLEEEGWETSGSTLFSQIQ